jgi:hypothetical protein
MRLAVLTVSPNRQYCDRMLPTMPLITRPLCTPTRMCTLPPSGLRTLAAAPSMALANCTTCCAWSGLSTSSPLQAM